MEEVLGGQLGEGDENEGMPEVSIESIWDRVGHIGGCKREGQDTQPLHKQFHHRQQESSLSNNVGVLR